MSAVLDGPEMKHPKLSLLERKAIVGFVHVLHNTRSRHDQHQMLRDEQRGPVRNHVVRHPHRSVLGHSKRTRHNAVVQ